MSCSAPHGRARTDSPDDDTSSGRRATRRQRHNAHRTAGFGITAGLLLALTACGSGAATSTGASVSAPNPNAPEVNAAGDIPDNQVYVPFSPSGGGFTVSVPQGWARSTESGATVFTDKYNSVRIATQPAPPTLDVATVKATELPALQNSVPGFALGKVSTVQRTAGQGVLVTYQATSQANQVTGAKLTLAVERYDFAHNGQEVVLTLSGPKGADNVDPWKTITNSLTWKQ